jgi:hypothetical protein
MTPLKSFLPTWPLSQHIRSSCPLFFSKHHHFQLYQHQFEQQYQLLYTLPQYPEQCQLSKFEILQHARFVKNLPMSQNTDARAVTTDARTVTTQCIVALNASKQTKKCIP